MDLKKEIAKGLLSIEAVFLRPEEPFTWASGIKSPISLRPRHPPPSTRGPPASAYRTGNQNKGGRRTGSDSKRKLP